MTIVIQCTGPLSTHAKSPYGAWVFSAHHSFAFESNAFKRKTLQRLESGFAPATVLRIEHDAYNGWLVHICAVYGGGNSLLFRCPACGDTHAHGAGCVGGASDGVKISPHGACHLLNGEQLHWCLHEVCEGMDVALAGDFSNLPRHLKDAKYNCPRRRGEPGYDQLARGRINSSARTAKLITAYKALGVKHD